MERDQKGPLIYHVYLTESCAKQYRKLQSSLGRSDNWQRICKKIEEIRSDPQIGDQLTGPFFKDLFSVHAGDYRVVYKFSHEKTEIEVWGIGHRNRVYEELTRYIKVSGAIASTTKSKLVPVPDADTK
jgi:mRNA-degrading endonuclease RelE of RelBE toxin-antitoxin system